LVVHGGTIYARADLDNKSLLAKLDSNLALGLSSTDIETILGQRADRDRRAKVNRVREIGSVRGKLLAAVGAGAILRRLPAALVATVKKEKGSLDNDTLSLLATVVYGVDAFRAFRAELDEAGFEPPTRWAGSYGAKKFVHELGLPIEYAGFEETPLEALLEVDGPPNLPPLHTFQKDLTYELRKVLKSEGSSRGLLALPTGAGKTRVTVQAFTEAFCEGVLKGVVLWVAQTEELCEQAVQTWGEVWRGLGPHGRLYISRLWTSNEAARSKTGSQVVIATIDKLQGCFEDPDYDWLSKADAVVIDEAHSAVTPSYTRLLEWLGMGRGRDRCPLVGLTATAFRGHSREETLRLVNRFGNRRIDDGVFHADPYEELQKLGVLASVKHDLLEGANIELTDEELELLRRTQLFPRSAEERVARNEDRNKKLVDSIIALPKDWPVLVFAASVEHAETLAALLTLRGVSAAPISAQTDTGPRRQFIEDFRNQKLRVLTNYGVLAQGFDAPAVRAVYVARPTFSPNLYQQMIGRGLRGPKNGGKSECLIVNVADNVLRYGDTLAFTHFNHLWAGS
jgi:superfamily II DNA or RNA helicase